MRKVGNAVRPLVRSKKPMMVSSVLVDRGAPGYRTSIITSDQIDVESVADVLARSDIFDSIRTTIQNADELVRLTDSFVPSKNGQLKTGVHWWMPESITRSLLEELEGESVVKAALLSQILISLFGQLGMVNKGRNIRVINYRESLFPTLDQLRHELRKQAIMRALEKLKTKLPSAANRKEVSVSALSAMISPILLEFSDDLLQAELIESKLEDSLYLIRIYLTQSTDLLQSADEQDIVNDSNLQMLAHNYTLASIAIAQAPRRPRRAFPLWEKNLAEVKAALGSMDRYKWERAEAVRDLFSHKTVYDGKGRLCGVIVFKNMSINVGPQVVYPLALEMSGELSVFSRRSEVVADVLARGVEPLSATLSSDFLSEQMWSVISNVAGAAGEPIAYALNMTSEEVEHYAATLCGMVQIGHTVIQDIESVHILFEVDAVGVPYFPLRQKFDSNYLTLDPFEAILLKEKDGRLGSGKIVPGESGIPKDMLGDIFLMRGDDKSILTDNLNRTLKVGIQVDKKKVHAQVDFLEAMGFKNMNGSRVVRQPEIEKQLKSFVSFIREMYSQTDIPSDWGEAGLDLNATALRRIVAQIVDNVLAPLHTSYAVRELAVMLKHYVTQDLPAADHARIRGAMDQAMTDMELRLEATKFFLTRVGYLELDDAQYLIDLYQSEGLVNNYALTTYKA